MKSHRPLVEGIYGIPITVPHLLEDIREYGDRIFGKEHWRLIDMRFTRELVKDRDGKNARYLSVVARLEPK